MGKKTLDYNKLGSRAILIRLTSKQHTLPGKKPLIYYVEAHWHAFKEDSDMCEFYIDVTTETGATYITGYECISKAIMVRPPKNGGDDSKLIVTKPRANRLLNRFNKAISDPIFKATLVKELDSEYKKGWEYTAC